MPEFVSFGDMQVVHLRLVIQTACGVRLFDLQPADVTENARQVTCPRCLDTQENR